MIWLTWRQFRGQALTALAALAALTVFLVFLGMRIRHSYDVNVGCTGCTAASAREALDNAYSDPLLLTGFLVVLLPAIIGAFWGAPLIAREIEAGTHRLVWNQSITRTRWLAVKLGFVTLAGVAVTGALSLLFTWAASPYDKLANTRFEPMFFPTRNIAPVGYAVFAVLAGVTIGLIARRTVLAMAITLAAFAALQILMPSVIRPHLQPPVTERVAFSANGGINGIGINESGEVSVQGYSIPGAWMLSPTAKLLDDAGNPVNRTVTESCFPGGGPDQAMACLAAKKLHVSVSYQPADRYWTFQWLEFAIYLALAGLLAGFAFWRIPRGLS
jgi:hypothetical protein